MSETAVRADGQHALAGLDSATEQLLTRSLHLDSDTEILESLRALERNRNRLAAYEQALLAQVRDRHLADEHGARNLIAFTRTFLRTSWSDARSRVAAMEAAGPLPGQTGEAATPIFPGVAAAQRSGVMSPAQARIVVDTVEKLPDEIAEKHDREVEQLLVEQAAGLDVEEFGKTAKQITDRLDPDRIFRDLAYREQRRDLQLHVRPDGSSRLEAELNAECTETLRVVLDALSAPKPEVDGVKDPRTAGQRRHDAFTDAMKAALRAGEMPSTSGVSTTIILTMPHEEWLARKGIATTSHGTKIPAKEAAQWASGDYRLVAVAFDKAKRVTAFGTGRRLFNEAQRLAIIARDKGCTFPGCDVAPAWCQIHHVTEHSKGGPTSIANGAALCGHHHRHFEQIGYTCHMIDGKPHWTAPEWLDPTQTPRTNPVHSGPIALPENWPNGTGDQ